MTEREQIAAIGVQVSDEVKEILKAQGVLGGRPDYREPCGTRHSPGQ